MDPKKYLGGKVTCTGCKTRTSDRIANLRTSVTLSITSGDRVLIGDFICTDCAKVRLEDDLALTAFLQNEHAATQSDQSFMDISAPEAGGAGGGPASAGGGPASAGATGGTEVGYEEPLSDSQPMSTDEEEEGSFPGLSQGSKGSYGVIFLAISLAFC